MRRREPGQKKDGRTSDGQNVGVEIKAKATDRERRWSGGVKEQVVAGK